MKLRWKEYLAPAYGMQDTWRTEKKLQYFVPSELMDRATGKPIPGQWIDVPVVDSNTPDSE